MDKKTTGIIATVVTVLLCGCPGLVGLCFGLVSTVAGFAPNADIDVFGNRDPRSALTMGLVVLCVSIIFIIIPVVVGFLTLRNKPVPVLPPDEPVPPTI